MNKRNLALLVLIIVCALLIGLLIYYFVFYNFDKSGTKQVSESVVVTPPATLITNNPSDTGKIETAIPNSAQLSAEDQSVQQDAGQVAKIFVERFGTYSNQAGAEQFSDLSLFVTAKMQTWVNGEVAKIISNQTDYRISHIVRTQAVSSKVSATNSDTATVIVGTRRTDQTGDEEPKISNPEIKLEVIKAGKRWKIDSVVWQ